MMKAKIVLTTAALTLASAMSVQAGCGKHEQQAMSCADGATWDSATKTCVPQTTS
jgi:hypothetical protein